MHIISAADFSLFCSKMPYFAFRMLASKMAHSARNSACRMVGGDRDARAMGRRFSWRWSPLLAS